MVALAALALLATAATLACVGLWWHPANEYIGEASINNQEDYRLFTETISSGNPARVVLLDNTSGATSINEYPTILTPTVMTFRIITQGESPISNVEELAEMIRYPWGGRNGIVGAHVRMVMISCVGVVGITGALGLWLGRNGFRIAE